MRYVFISFFLVISALALDDLISEHRALGNSGFIIDSAPSFISALFIPLAIIAALKLSKTGFKLGIGYCIGAIIYETLQDKFGTGVFDKMDLLVSLVALLILSTTAFFVLKKRKLNYKNRS